MYTYIKKLNSRRVNYDEDVYIIMAMIEVMLTYIGDDDGDV